MEVNLIQQRIPKMDKALLDWFEKQPRWKQNDILNAQYFDGECDTFRGKIVMAMNKDAVAIPSGEIAVAINLVADREMICAADTLMDAIDRLNGALLADGADECEISLKTFHLKMNEVHAL